MVWDLTVSQSFDRYCSAKGDGCMRDTDHHIRHPRGHLGDRVSARWTSGCAQQETSFGARGENVGEAAEEGRNYALQLRLQHLLQLGMRISPGKARK